MQNPQNLYTEILTTSLEKLRKALPKKHKDIKEMIQTFQEQAKTDKQLDANKYFGVYKLCIDTKDPKLTEICINQLYRLISNSFLSGNCRDFVSNLPVSGDQNGEGNAVPQRKRKLIDSIVESICSCKHEKNESLQLQIVRVLVNIVTGLVCEPHGNSLREILDTLFTIHTTSKNAEIQVTAKAAIIQMVNVVFQRMEEYNAVEEDARIEGRRTARGLTSFVPAKRKSMADPNQSSSTFFPATKGRASYLDVPQRYSFPIRQSTLQPPMSPENPVNTTFAGVLEQMNIDFGDQKLSPTILRDSPAEKYLLHYIRNLVDDVCIHDQKVEDFKKEHERELINERISQIPLRSVPMSFDPNDPQYRMIQRVKIENEKGRTAGFFGWCFICREPADYYCKDTRVPVCSIDCKLRHQDELEELEKPPKEQGPPSHLVYIEDAVQVFDYLCKISGKDLATDLSSSSIRSKTASLELLVGIMTKPQTVFLMRKEFKNIVKESLCDSILKNSISTDKPIFASSLEIFTSLVTYSKESLKAEIPVFIENIFLHMLESGNSSYNHRSLALQVLHKLMSGPKTVLEFYVNYDCSINSTNLVEQMIELLCKIAQGKYLRPEFSSLIMPAQETYLRILALESLVNMVKSLVQFTLDYQKHLQKGMEENTKVRKIASMDNEKELDDRDSSGGEDNRDMTVIEKDEEIGQQRQLKKELQKAIHKFNFKFKVGMKSFAQLKVIDPEDPKSIAAFFKNTPNLSKERLGEYFGEEAEFFIKVLTEYVELIDFTNLTLDDGLRKLLQHFILPGEGQKIDRIMQVFASKHFKDNPTSFNSASAAYTLSYLLIMLQTDAHNPHIKERDRMKLPSFIKLAKGINDGEDLSEEELTGYYNRILEVPLGIHTAGEAKKAQVDMQNQSIKDKERQFKLESAKMLVKGQELIKQKQDISYYKVKNPEYIRPLFKEIIWSPVLAVFSVQLEKSDDPKITQLCIEGFTNCIILTGSHNMDTERDTFVSSLAKFTNLTALREFKDKNAFCLKALLQLASTHGNLLRMSWLFVLECISKIDYYLNYNPNKEQDQADGIRASRNDSIDMVELYKSEIVKEIVDVHSVNCIFSRSSSFELEEIIDFINCLCKTSEEELKSPQGPRTYSLQKLVEVAHFNLDRVKFVWTQIWNVTREFISRVAVTSAPEVAFFAVDSLKQLSLKFLIKEELASVEFQKEFLRPFATIFQKVDNIEIKELVLNCCSYIIMHVGNNLKSGWKSILDILALGAESDKLRIIRLSFAIAEGIMKENLDHIKEMFSEFIILWIRFSRCKNEEIAIMSLERLKIMIIKMIQESKPKTPDSLNHLPNGHLEVPEIEPLAKSHSKPPEVTPISESTWIALFTSLFTLCSDPRKVIRREGTTILFEILKGYGKEFTTDFWQVILSGVIKPLFDEIQFYFQSKSEEELLSYNDSCREIFSNMIDVYFIYYHELSSFTEDFLTILVHCIENPKGNLAKISINALKLLITQCHTKFSPKEWSMMVSVCSKIVDHTTPHQLLAFESKSPVSEGKKMTRHQRTVSFNSEECLTQCIVQLLMIALIKDMAETYEEYLSNEQLHEILNTLNMSYQFAKTFNDQIYLRFYLWKNGLMKEMDQLPGLLKQGKEALGAYILILHMLYERKRRDPNSAPLEKQKYLDEFLGLGFNLMSTISSKNEEFMKLMQDKEKVREDTYIAESPMRKGEMPTFDEQVLMDSFNQQSDRLISLELEKEILHARTILAVVFLPKLLLIDPAEIKNKIKEITQQLIKISSYNVPKPLIIGENAFQVSKVYAINEDSSLLIRDILNKYFEYTFSNMKG